jgi:hypothetical protein
MNLNIILIESYISLVINQALYKIDKEHMSFINIYCSKSIYSYLNKHEYVFNNKNIYFKLDKNKKAGTAGFELENDKNIIDSSEFFYENIK